MSGIHDISWIGRSLAAVALVALLAPLGCVEDGTWIDEYTVVLDEPANALVALSIGGAEGNLSHNDSYYFAESEGIVLDEVYGSGEHVVTLVSETPHQRSEIVFVAWADDPDQGFVGEPDCEEDGARLRPHTGENGTYVIPSYLYPLSWCGALIDEGEER